MSTCEIWVLLKYMGQRRALNENKESNRNYRTYLCNGRGGGSS